MPNNGPSATIPPGADDFTRIRGISSKIASRLYDAGILTFAKLASMSPNVIIARIGTHSGITAESITKKAWIAQARELAAETEAEDEESTRTEGQHRADFAVKLQLNANNTVNQTHIMHMQSGGEDMWDGWAVERLINFFVQRAALAPSEPSVMAAAAGAGAPQAVATGTLSPAATSRPMGTLRSHKLEVVPANPAIHSKLLRHNQPFNVRLSLNLTEVEASGQGPLAYTATLYAKNLGSKYPEPVGEASGTITPAETVSLDVEGLSLSTGAYRLGASVILNSPAEDQARRSNYSAYVESGVIQVS